MHEISLVRNIFKMIDESFPGQLENVRTIRLSAGLLSNVQPVLMQSAFAAVLKDEPRYARATLVVDVIPIIIKCDVCNKNTEIKNSKFYCSCGKPCRNIIQGEELLVSGIEFFEETSSLLI